jgi:hypothetical protein
MSIIEEAQLRFNEAVGGKYNATLVSTTNDNFTRYIDWTNELVLQDLKCTFGQWFRTSYTASVKLDGRELTVNTRNSTYVFRIDVILNEDFNLSKEEQDVIEAYLLAMYVGV